MSKYLQDGKVGDPIFIFAHGAGAGMTHPFMESMARAIAKGGIHVVRFNFPYMEKHLTDGRKRPPDRAPILLDVYREVIDDFYSDVPIFIGGKSMGGRMASLIAEKAEVSGLICLGFPFHPPGKPENFKGDHLQSLSIPSLIIQGERDTFGKRAEFEHFDLSKTIQTQFITDGDHSFKPRKSSGLTEHENLLRAAHLVQRFIKEQPCES
jgi:predicted alpha/beta-hydrolase family hydrolase